MEAPARPHRRLIWKYTAVVVTLVAAAIVSVGLTELYFAYQDSKTALTRVERDKASTAATSIEQLMQEILRELDGVAQPTVERGRQVWTSDIRSSSASSSVTSSSDSSGTWTRPGRSSVRTSPLEIDRIGSGVDFSTSPTFIRARADQRYLGRRLFRAAAPGRT